VIIGALAVPNAPLFFLFIFLIGSAAFILIELFLIT
jgi:hypothetical protein